jgi:hypothetical protein
MLARPWSIKQTRARVISCAAFRSSGEEADVCLARQNSGTTVCSQYSPYAVELSYRQSLSAVPATVAYETLPDSVGPKIVGQGAVKSDTYKIVFETGIDYAFPGSA